MIAPCPWCGPVGRHHVSMIVVLRDGCQDGQPDAWAGYVSCRGCACESPWAKADTRDGAEASAWRRWGRRFNPATGRIEPWTE